MLDGGVLKIEFSLDSMCLDRCGFTHHCLLGRTMLSFFYELDCPQNHPQPLVLCPLSKASLMLHQLCLYQSLFFLLTFCRPPGSIIDSKGPFEARNDGPGRTTRHFFDDWPKPIPETDNGSNSVASATNLSISMPGNPVSDFSLKLGTGNGDEGSTQDGSSEREKPMSNWEMMWGANPVAPMGGPLAEALRSSMSTSSPTSVLHRLPRGGAVSEASYISY